MPAIVPPAPAAATRPPAAPERLDPKRTRPAAQRCGDRAAPPTRRSHDPDLGRLGTLVRGSRSGSPAELFSSGSTAAGRGRRSSAETSAAAAERLLAEVLHPRFPRALFGIAPARDSFDEEALAPDFDLGAIRRAVEHALGHLATGS